jgi:hypothetical protein
MSLSHRLTVVLLAALGMSLSLRAAESVAPEQFDRLHKVIKPQGAELKWMQIRWLTDLWEARKQAAEQGKPILLWEMDGHPLGCT